MDKMLEHYLESKKEFVESELLKFLPNLLDGDWIRKNLPFYKNDNEILNKIFSPIQNLLSRGGKRWRPILMMLCSDVFGGGSKIEELIPVVEIIHNGTLMIDDIEDNSETRRGKPSIHRIFGVDVTINAGNLMYYLPYIIFKDVDLDKKTKISIFEIINEEMLKLHIGQGMDIFWHNGGNIGLDEEAYLEMCKFKTGTLARMSAKIGAIMGNANKWQIKKIEKFAETIGIAFQIQDDILNITNEKWGKCFGDDISEGKRTLMVIKVLEKASIKDKKRLLNILKMKTNDTNYIREAIIIMRKYNAIEYASRKAKKLVKTAWKELDPYLKESESKKKLKLFADFLIERDI